jgi:hypothetical protein
MHCSYGRGLYLEPANITAAGSTFTLNASSEAWSPPERVRALLRARRNKVTPQPCGAAGALPALGGTGAPTFT